MGMLKMELDDMATVRRRRRQGPTRIATPKPTPRGPRRVTVTTLAVRPRLDGCI